ncbi:MAG: 3'-5' exonuclease [Neisseria sp.]|nr:3'-5' exonuclease [Neisseria sp.]
MAKIIPSLNKQTLGKMTAGERHVARCLEKQLEDDYLIWYDIPIGKIRRYPDFIILHPARGLLFLEVKDWKADTIQKINRTDVTLLTKQGVKTVAHPLEQARQCTYQVINQLCTDKVLCQTSEKYQGKLITPYGWGCIFTNLTREYIHHHMPEDTRDLLLPDHLIMYKDDLSEDLDGELFQEKLWNMFHYQFSHILTLPEINRIRWHLFPEIRIDTPTQEGFFDEEDSNNIANTLPDIVKIMDVQQEQLARSLGEGHRVIHGVAGSGKTLILGYRCLHLAGCISKPILVLCFNITLAIKLKSFIAGKGLGHKVQVYHFHDWCGQQVKTYHIDIPESDRPVYDRCVEAVIQGVDKGHIPREQYGAVLIDEGHDFEESWLKLITQMIDPENDSLLLLYDDAQSIYKNKTGLGFSLSSVGIRAQGRTTVLKLNYRNTREILEFAYQFSRDYLSPYHSDEDHIPLIQPESAGTSGQHPVVKALSSWNEELEFLVKCLKKWHEDGLMWKDMAVLHEQKWQADNIASRLRKNQIPFSKDKKGYDPSKDQVTLLTFASSKGLEFLSVTLVGIGFMKDDEEVLLDKMRLLYVAMTRAQKQLLITYSGRNKITERLQNNF